MKLDCLSAPRAGLLAVSLALLLAAAPLQAMVVLDTFGPGDSATGPDWALYNPSVPTPDSGGQSLGVPFSLASAATISDILTSISGVGTFSLGIVAGAGLPSGATLFSAALTNPTANVLLSGLSWALAAGDYWLVSKASVGSNGGWQGGGLPGTVPWAFTFNSPDTDWTFTTPNGAPATRISVSVSAIPEPGTWALMVCGLALVGWQAGRREGRTSA
jgi:hypothetical protein